MTSEDRVINEIVTERGGDPALLLGLELALERWLAHHPQYGKETPNMQGVRRMLRTVGFLQDMLIEEVPS